MQFKLEFDNRIRVAVIAACVTALVVGGAVAFLTNKVEQKTSISVVTSSGFNGGVQLDVDKTPQAAPLNPGETIAQNPTVTNISDGNAWIFLKVQVPHETATVGAGPAAQHDMFTFTPDLANFRQIADDTLPPGTTVYVLSKGGSTASSAPQDSAPLFTDLSYLNFTEFSQPANVLDVRYTAYAVSDGGEFADENQAWQAAKNAYPQA